MRQTLGSACRGLRFARDGLPVDAFGIGPKSFEVIQCPGIRQHDVQDDVSPILQQPGADAFPFGIGDVVAERLHLHAGFAGQGGHGARVVTGGDDEEVHDRRDRGQIQNDRILAAKFLAQTGDPAGVGAAFFQTDFLLRGERRGRCRSRSRGGCERGANGSGLRSIFENSVYGKPRPGMM